MKMLDVPKSGSINYRTASRNRNGQYLRARSIPVQPRSAAQLAIRGYLSLCSQTWRNLTKVQQLGWRTWAAGHTTKDSLGQQQTMTGEQAYVSVNSFLMLCSTAVTPTPPADPDFSAFVPGVLSSTALSITLTGYVRPASGQIAIWVSKPGSNGQNFFGKGLFIMTTTLAATTPLNVATQVAARWGTLRAGQVVQVSQIPWVNGVQGARIDSLLTLAT